MKNTEKLMAIGATVAVCVTAGTITTKNFQHIKPLRANNTVSVVCDEVNNLGADDMATCIDNLWADTSAYGMGARRDMSSGRTKNDNVISAFAEEISSCSIIASVSGSQLYINGPDNNYRRDKTSGNYNTISIGQTNKNGSITFTFSKAIATVSFACHGWSDNYPDYVGTVSGVANGTFSGSAETDYHFTLDEVLPVGSELTIASNGSRRKNNCAIVFTSFGFGVAE